MPDEDACTLYHWSELNVHLILDICLSFFFCLFECLRFEIDLNSPYHLSIHFMKLFERNAKFPISDRHSLVRCIRNE